MAIDRQGFGLTILRVCIGVFFFFEGIGKIRWFANSSLLAGQFAGWAHAAAPGSISAWYLERIATPGLAVFARLVPLGEICVGAALVVGFWTPVAAFLAFFMALNFQIASGAIVQSSFLTSGYGLPVLGATLALAIGGVRLRWSVR
jgi:thiosulfate dehydrogenase (quinone) large subunit